MQPTLVYIFFLTTCGLAQETSFPDSVVKILLDGKKLPSAVENPAPNPEDDDISNNVEDLQSALIAERAKNRDLNQTISDILERIADMEMDIISNEEKITQAQSSVVLLSKDVDDLQEDVEENSALITNVIDDVVSLTSSDQQQTVQIESLGARGHWCAARTINSWNTVGTITYDRITYSDSNMNIAATPLDINTGINSQCYYYLRIGNSHETFCLTANK